MRLTRDRNEIFKYSMNQTELSEVVKLKNLRRRPKGAMHEFSVRMWS